MRGIKRSDQRYQQILQGKLTLLGTECLYCAEESDLQQLRQQRAAQIKRRQAAQDAAAAAGYGHLTDVSTSDTLQVCFRDLPSLPLEPVILVEAAEFSLLYISFCVLVALATVAIDRWLQSIVLLTECVLR